MCHDEIDAASESSLLRVGLRKAGEAVAEFVMAGAVDDLRITTLASRETLAHEYAVKR